MRKCLYCYKPLTDGEIDFHKSCARKIFESTAVPELPYTRANIKDLAREIVTASTTVTGVQAKLSLDIARGQGNAPQRFTIVGLWGRFILKPQTELYANLPENEDLSMHLAEAAGIRTVPHSLIRFSDGELCYITRRIDRTQRGDKVAMEDEGISRNNRHDGNKNSNKLKQQLGAPGSDSRSAEAYFMNTLFYTYLAGFGAAALDVDAALRTLNTDAVKSVVLCRGVG